MIQGAKLTRRNGRRPCKWLRTSSPACGMPQTLRCGASLPPSALPPRAPPWPPASQTGQEGRESLGHSQKQSGLPPRPTQWESPSQSFQVLQYMVFSKRMFGQCSPGSPASQVRLWAEVPSWFCPFSSQHTATPQVILRGADKAHV